MQAAKSGTKVRVHYQGSLEDGTVFDSSYEREPVEFTLGEGQIISGLENAVYDMTQGEKKRVHVPSQEAFGEHDETLIQQVPRNQLAADVEPAQGQVLRAQTQEGQEIRFTVTEVADETITVDANHPLAGKPLVLDVELVEIVE